MADILNSTQKDVQNTSLAVVDSMKNIIHFTEKTDVDLTRMTDMMQIINEGGQSITNIISLINDISDKINLLSLNAAIEAARAGEHGRGFAVVADEIGKLATATSDNSKQISTQVSSIIRDITEGTALMNSTKKQLEQTFGIINTVTTSTKEVQSLVLGQDAAINRIVTQAGLMDNLSKDIESATKKQSQAIGSALKTISRLAEMARDISGTNSRIMELTAVVKEKSFQMSNVIKEVG